MYRLGVLCIPYTIRSPTSQISLFDLYQEADLGRPPGAQCKRCSRKGTLVMVEKPLLETIPVFRFGRKRKKLQKEIIPIKSGGFCRFIDPKILRPKQNFYRDVKKSFQDVCETSSGSAVAEIPLGEKTSQFYPSLRNEDHISPTQSTKVFHEMPNVDVFV